MVADIRLDYKGGGKKERRSSIVGAAARPCLTHQNTTDIPMYTRIEYELYLTRLILGEFNYLATSYS